MPTQSAAFTQVYIGDYANTLSEWSAYITDIDYPMTRNPIDVTAFNAGGAPATRNVIEGAIQTTVPITFLFDPVVWNFLMQIWGARGGSTVMIYNGRNAAPQAGDQIWKATMTLFKVDPTYDPNKQAKIATSFMPTDGGAITPGWYLY